MDTAKVGWCEELELDRFFRTVADELLVGLVVSVH